MNQSFLLYWHIVTINHLHNILRDTADCPEIIDYETEVSGLEWDEVTLRVNFTGNPRPTVTWKFEDSSCDLEDDFSIEMNSDGSLLFVCIEKRHEGR